MTPEEQKIQLEIAKLAIEVENATHELKELKKKWYWKPSNLAPFATICAAAFGVVYGHYSGLFSNQTTMLENKKHDLQLEIFDFQKQKDSIRLSMAVIMDSVRILNADNLCALAENNQLEKDKIALRDSILSNKRLKEIKTNAFDTTDYAKLKKENIMLKDSILLIVKMNNVKTNDHYIDKEAKYSWPAEQYVNWTWLVLGNDNYWYKERGRQSLVEMADSLHVSVATIKTDKVDWSKKFARDFKYEGSSETNSQCFVMYKMIFSPVK